MYPDRDTLSNVPRSGYITARDQSMVERGVTKGGKPPRGGGYFHTLPIRVCAAQRGRDFEAPDLERGYPFQRRFLERGIIFRTHESSTFVSRHLKLFKDRLLLNIRFNALTSKPLYACCTLERSIKNWPISRTGYQF